jgi:hypothetical protein
VLLTGLTTIAATLAGAASGEYPIHPGVFFPGFIVSIAVFLAFKRRLTIGRVQPWQERLIRAAMSLEASLILLIWIVVRDITARNFWALVLLAVGVHFLPYVMTAGPLIGWLALLSILNAVLALVLGSVPFAVFGVLHGLLCVVFGSLMLAVRPKVSG